MFWLGDQARPAFLRLLGFKAGSGTSCPPANVLETKNPGWSSPLVPRALRGQAQAGPAQVGPTPVTCNVGRGNNRALALANLQEPVPPTFITYPCWRTSGTMTRANC